MSERDNYHECVECGIGPCDCGEDAEGDDGCQGCWACESERAEAEGDDATD